MNKEDIALKLTCMLRRAGLANVPRPILAGACFLGLLLVLFCLFHFWPQQSDSFAIASAVEEQSASSSATKEEADTGTIMVDIEGCVISPGLYTLEADCRVGDAISAAGGLTEDAAPAAINLAQKLEDGEQVMVLSKGDIENDISNQNDRAANTAQDTDGQKININSASAEELQKLSGIGPSLAERIIDYREANGKFKSIDEIKNVSGIGQTRFDNLKDKICT